MTTRTHIKRETDLQILSDWISEGTKVMDLGCGRGILLEHLKRNKNVWTLGVEVDSNKIESCIKRGVNAYQGDAMQFLKEMPDNTCDWVVLSRTLQELNHPGSVIREALRVGKNVAVGFANFGYWRNRLAILKRGSLSQNEVFSSDWSSGAPYNPITVQSFEAFCQASAIQISNCIYLRGDWKRNCRIFPRFRAGYALYHLKAR